MSDVVKLSSPETKEFWEIPVLYEDEQLLALAKPAGLLAAPEPGEPARPSLTGLLWEGIAQGKPWAAAHRLAWLSPAYRIDAEASGVMCFAKSKEVAAVMADFLGSEQPARRYLALVWGTPGEETFEVNARLGAHQVKPGLMRVDPGSGKRARTEVKIFERFSRHTLVTCVAWTDRPHQVRVHLRYSGLPVAGDQAYGARALLLSELKPVYRLKPNRTERPLLSRPALHAESLEMPHPVTGQPLSITAPWPKDLTVAVKYLRLYTPVAPTPPQTGLTAKST